MLRRVNCTSMKLQVTLHAPTATDCVLAEDDAVLRRLDCEYTQIEELVVQRAQRQSVGFDVWTANVVPLNMCRFQARWHMPNSQVKSADTATVLVGAQHAIPEAGIAFASSRGGVLKASHCTIT